MRAFRPPADLDAYIEKEVAEGGIGRSSLIIHMLETARDVRLELGDDWHEITRIAAVEKSTPGKVLARLVKQGMKKK